MQSQPVGDVRDRLRHLAEETFGWTSLRPEQMYAMEQILAGRDVLVVMPTGSGKSAIYQVPALELGGPTVVVSPLIALQRDQIDRLDASSAPEAVAVNSAQGARECARAWEELDRRKAEYIFLSPEQLANEDAIQRLQASSPSLFVVDEAHCVSTWGHDFRPDYLNLAQVIDRLGHPRVLALTATAGGHIQDDIVAGLGMRDEVRIVTGFDRPNLYLAVRPFVADGDKRAGVIDWATSASPPGILYAATRKDTERYSADLNELGIPAAPFHAGLPAAERERVQTDFMADRIAVVVATSAFGMGIDKPNVRFVGHVSAPESLDAYYQQIGRSGRDGERADAVLFHRTEDLGLQRFLTSRRIHPEAIREMVEAVRDHGRPIAAAELSSKVSQSRRAALANLHLLEQAQVVRPAGQSRFTYAADVSVPEAIQRTEELFDRRRRLDHSRIDMLREYGETRSCRRQFLLGYFGETLSQPCGFCDNCDAGTADDRVVGVGANVRFSPQSRVRHRQWGWGWVVHRETDRLTVQFDEAGYRTLLLAAVVERDLLSEE